MLKLKRLRYDDCRRKSLKKPVQNGYQMKKLCSRDTYEFKIERGYKVFCCSDHVSQYLEEKKKNKKLSKSDEEQGDIK